MLSFSSGELSPEHNTHTVLEDNNHKSGERKKRSKFKSLDLKMLSPRNLFSPNSKDGSPFSFGFGEGSSSSSSAFKLGGSSLFQSFGQGKKSTFFTPIRESDHGDHKGDDLIKVGSVASLQSKESSKSVISHADSSLPPLPRIIVPEYVQFVEASTLAEFEDLHDKQLINPYVGREYFLSELDALLKVKAKLRFRFLPKACEFFDESTHTYEQFDQYQNILIVHVGQLFDRPEVFQLQSAARGICLYEAASLREKLEVCGLIMFFAQNPSFNSIAQHPTLTTISPSLLTATSDQETEDEEYDIDLGAAPIKFVRLLKGHVKEFEDADIKIKTQQIELMNLKNHFTKLESNTVALADGIKRQRKVNSDSRGELEQLKANFREYAETVKTIREKHLDKIQHDVEVTFPELLDKVKVRIELWADQDRKMRRSIEFLNKFQFIIFASISGVVFMYLSIYATLYLKNMNNKN